MATSSSVSDSETSGDHSGKIQGGSYAEATIGSLVPQEPLGVGSCTSGGPSDPPSAGSGDQGGNQDERKEEETDEVKEDKESKKDERKEEETDEVKEDKDAKKDERKEEEDDEVKEDAEIKEDEEGMEEEGDGSPRDMMSDKDEEDQKLKLKEEELRKEERANRNALLLLTGLLVMAMPVMVWRSINQPELLFWQLSLLICCCCLIWSRLLDATMSMHNMLPIFSSGFLLALYADAKGDHTMGALLAHLNSYLAVGMLGYALAERRQRDGVEVSAAGAASRDLSDESTANNMLFFQVIGGLHSALVTLGLSGLLAWLLWHRADYSIEELFISVFIALSGILMFWFLFVAGVLLRGELIQEEGMILLVLYVGILGLLLAMISRALGETGTMIFCSLALLGFPGLFGYSLSVYASFKLRLKLQVKADESKVESTPSAPVLD